MVELAGKVNKGLPNHLDCLRATLMSWGRQFSIVATDSRGKPKPFNLLHMEAAMAYSHMKSVFVRAYRRFRFGQWEMVCQHYRSWPGQMVLF